MPAGRRPASRRRAARSPPARARPRERSRRWPGSPRSSSRAAAPGCPRRSAAGRSRSRRATSDRAAAAASRPPSAAPTAAGPYSGSRTPHRPGRTPCLLRACRECRRRPCRRRTRASARPRAAASLLSVKSCFTRTPPPWKPITATRSAGVICVLMYFRAALYARSRSGGGIAVRSKYRTSSRRLRYRMSPGGDDAIRASVVGATLFAAAGGGAAGAAGAAASGVPSPIVTWPDAATVIVGRRWNSTKLTICGSPSSVTMKSFAVRPSIGLPVLVLDGDRLHDQPRRAAERRGRLLLRRLLRKHSRAEGRRDPDGCRNARAHRVVQPTDPWTSWTFCDL